MVCSAQSILPRNLFYREQLSQTSIILSRCAEEKALRDCFKIDLDQHHWPQRRSWFVLFDQFNTDPRFECFHQSKHVQVISVSSVQYHISSDNNLDQNSASESRPNFSLKILNKLQLKISTKFQPQNLDQSSASKYQQKFSIKIFNKHH